MKQACILYGQAVEAILEMESCGFESTGSNEALHDEFDIIRPTLFLNLAAANLKLGGLEESLRCCNSVIQLCNSPGLLYSSMTSAEEFSSIIHPIAEAMQSLITKALFRRGKCSEALGDSLRAIEDYQAALAVSPTDKEIQRSITSIEEKVHYAQKSLRNVTATATARAVTMSPPSSQGEEHMTNGGRCWMRRGTWSQTVSECTVRLPLAAILQGMNRDISDHSPNSTGNSICTSASHSTLKKWRIEFRSHLVTIHAYQRERESESESAPTPKLELELGHSVRSSECTWTLDLNSTTDSRIHTSCENEGDSEPNGTDPGSNSCIEGCLVLHLSKSPSSAPSSNSVSGSGSSSKSSSEWFPGQEVFNVLYFIIS